MSGVRGRSGGKRAGAGRKPLPPEYLNSETPVPITEVAPTIAEVDSVKPPKPPKKAIKTNTIENMRNLVCPVEFETMPFAKQAWQYVLTLDEKAKLLNERQFENLKSYCLAIEIRQNLILEWERQGKIATIRTRNGELRTNPIISEISKQSDRINNFASDLGLTVLGEFKVAKEQSTSPKLNGEEKKDDDLFD